MAAGVTDYIDKTWPITYSPGSRRRHRARDFEHVSFADQFFSEPLPFDRTVFRGASALTRGYLWDNAFHEAVSFRNYGMYTQAAGRLHRRGQHLRCHPPRRPPLRRQQRRAVPGLQPRCSDHAQRLPEWQREFDAYENAFRADPSKDPLPALSILRLPNDHTWGTAPGKAIPESYIADNDLALGRLVERVSKSPFWPNTAIMVTEDDAQNGPDHVDAHRTLALRDQPLHADRACRPHALRHRARWSPRSRTCSACRR